MIGEKLGSYTIIDAIGSGSLGTVYQAEDSNGRLVALKLVRSQILNTLQRREQFLRFALAASEIRDQGICPILEIGDDNDDLFVIMPYLNGKTLEQYMDKRALSWPHALDIALAAGSAIVAIHNAGSVHRGLKPANLWILEGQEPNVIVSDCGLSRFTETCRREATGSAGSEFFAVGTPSRPESLSYMSPEQLRGEQLDHRTDIFSFGAILYEMLSGRHPFKTSSSLCCLRAILESNPPPISSRPVMIQSRLEPILNKALAKNRGDRYQSMQTMLTEIKVARESDLGRPSRSKMPSGIQKWLSAKFRRHLRT